MRKKDEAVELLNNVIKTANKLPNLLILPYAYYELAITYYNKGELNKAGELFEVVLERFNNSVKIYDRDGIIWEQERWFIPSTLFQLGMKEYRQNNYIKSKTYFEKLIKDYPKSKNALSAKNTLERLKFNIEWQESIKQYRITPKP